MSIYDTSLTSPWYQMSAWSEDVKEVRGGTMSVGISSPVGIKGLSRRVLIDATLVCLSN